MRQSRFTQEQIVAILNQSENGISISDLTRKLGISEATFYRCLSDGRRGRRSTAVWE